jgi:bifunctional ADP-heptose synthase (sugar kinase/adenylyltransferase)
VLNLTSVRLAGRLIINNLPHPPLMVKMRPNTLILMVIAMEYKFSEARVLVVGDAMLDSYWFGPTLRTSPEAPVPIVNIEKKQYRPGGAGNVAMNIVSLHAKVTLLGFCGDDTHGTLLEELLTKAGVNCFFATGTKPTNDY